MPTTMSTRPATRKRMARSLASQLVVVALQDATPPSIEARTDA
jgi:hypothetical protein